MEKCKNFTFELFNVRINKEKYAIVKKWWEDRKWAVPKPSCLATTGIMIYDNKKPICAAWLYQTDSLMAVIGFLIADLETKGKVKRDAVKFLLIKLEEEAKNMGFTSIFFPIEADSVARLGIKELNYKSSLGKTNELAKVI